MPYNILIKTGDAEIRALEEINFDSIGNRVNPIIEITRGRKTKNDSEGNLHRRLDRLNIIFKNYSVILDATTIEDLSNHEIKELYKHDNGYENWLNFLDKQKTKFAEVIPTILVDDYEKVDFEANLLLQVRRFSETYKRFCYRCNIKDDGILDDIELFQSNGIDISNMFVIIDCEFMRPSAWKSFSLRAIDKISQILKIAKVSRFIVISTTFPKIVAEFGQDDEDHFILDEIKLYDAILNASFERNVEIEYGDYGTINPERNDSNATSWVPRVDVPLYDRIYYKRTRKDGKAYKDAYVQSAIKAVEDVRFPSELKCWGVDAIKAAAAGIPGGSNPAFWISVRMNIHIIQQLKRLLES